MARYERLTLPLRGLAAEGAQAIVDDALHALPGIRTARADIVMQVLRIEYDVTRISEADVHDALQQAGIVHVADA